MTPRLVWMICCSASALSLKKIMAIYWKDLTFQRQAGSTCFRRRFAGSGWRSVLKHEHPILNAGAPFVQGLFSHLDHQHDVGRIFGEQPLLLFSVHSGLHFHRHMDWMKCTFTDEEETNCSRRKNISLTI